MDNGKHKPRQLVKKMRFQKVAGVKLGYQKACGTYGCVYFDADTKFGKAAVVKDFLGSQKKNKSKNCLSVLFNLSSAVSRRRQIP